MHDPEAASTRGGHSDFDLSYNARPVESIDSSDSPVHALFFAPKIHR